MKILVIVIAAEFEPYVSLKKACKSTWGSSTRQDIQVLYLHAIPDTMPHIINDDLIVSGDEGMRNIGYKTLQAFEYCLNSLDFDYIFRTNLSSYVHLNGLFKYAQALTPISIYKGVIGNHKGISFASGSGYLISKDLVKYTLEHKDKWEHIELLDDVALAQVLSNGGISPTPINRIDIIHNKDLLTFDTSIIQNCFHFRCKNDFDRTHDVRVMNQLHSYFNKL